MRCVRMFNLKRIVLFLCIASGLTSSVNNEPKTDGAPKNISTNVDSSNTSSTIIQTKADQVVPTTIVPSISVKDLGAKNINIVQTEGGPISNLPSVQSPLLDQKITATNDSTAVAKNASTEIYVTQNTTTKTDMNLPLLERRRGHIMLDEPTVDDDKQSTEIRVAVEDDHVTVNSSKVEKISANISGNSTQLNNTNAVVPTPSMSEKKQLLNNVTSTMPPSIKHKPNPKPTVTMGGGAADPNKPIPPSPTKSSPLGMPRKIDYIIPIAITVVALPILGVTTFVLYNRGKDCWDKRHYRRMDFLIDGMYND